MVSALDGITVLDMTEGQAGAMATMLLADHGARVIRIELPGGELTRQRPGYHVWDRGKESIILELPELLPGKAKGGQARPQEQKGFADVQVAYDQLLRAADVLVESCPPSSEYQALADYSKLSSQNPRLVHCSITAYGRMGPLRDEPPVDDLVMARAGILATQPGFRPGPVHIIHPLPSTGAAILAVQGIVAALFAREKTGRGRKVETSLLSGALLFHPKLVGEKLVPNPFQAHYSGSAPFYSVYECADGNWVQLGCVHIDFISRAAEVMGIKHVIDSPKYSNRWSLFTEESRRELADVVSDVIKTRPFHEWAEIFEKADVPHARACTTEEALNDPQVRANEMLVTLEESQIGPVAQMGVAAKLSATPGKVRGPMPLRGQHTAQVLSALSGQKPRQERKQHRSQGLMPPPLEGIKVLEITNLIAGPTAGKCLANLGADVVKMEPLEGDISRPIGRTYFFYVNANKRSLSTNTRTPEGKEIARRLAAKVDILLANMRPRATERMGIGPEDLKKLNPRIIETHITGYGWTGPYSHRPGIDPLAQALMGLQRAQGGPENPPVFHSQLAPTDYCSGAMGAFGAILALFVREKTGQVQRVDTNLLNGGIVLSSEAFMKYRGKPPRRLADKGQYGLDALHRLYETKDCWLYLAADSQGDWLKLCKALNSQKLGTDARFTSEAARRRNDAVLAKYLAQEFGTRSAADWESRLRDAGVPCAAVAEGRSEQFLNHPNSLANDMVICLQHPVLGRMELARNLIKFGDTAELAARPTPLLGEHAKEVLQDLGYSEREVEELYQKNVIKTEHAPQD